MEAAHTEKGSAPGKWLLITIIILGSVVIGASIWCLARALSVSSAEPADRASSSSSAAAALNAGLSQEEIERKGYMDDPPATPGPMPAAAQPAAVPTNRNNDEVILQKAKANVNQRIVARMKQYVKDHPNLDTRSIEEQIKKREQQGAQSR